MRTAETLSQLLSELRSLDVWLWAEGDKLRFNAPDGVFTPELRTQVVENRDEILAFLREASAAVHQASQPIEPVARDGDLPLSFAQQRLWFFDQLVPHSAAYNLSSAVRLTGALDLSALQRTLDELVRRHESLRTTFPAVLGEPQQQIHPFRTQPLPVDDLSARSIAEREEEAQRSVAAEAKQHFDLAQGPLFRTRLLRLADDEHLFLMSMHHIISDGSSIGVLVREIAALYTAYASGQTSPLPELPVQYTDYAYWQREWLRDEVLEAQLAYWTHQLTGALALLELPLDRPRPSVQSFRGAYVPFELPDSLSDGLRTLSRQTDSTLFMALLAAFNLLLHRYSGQEQVVVGAPNAGRNRAELEGLIGFFINMQALRTDLSGNPSFRSLLQQVRETVLGAQSHQDLPFDYLIDELKLERDLSYTPLFQTVFQLQKPSRDTLSLPGLTLEPLATSGQTTKFDLTLSMVEDGERLAGAVEYNSDLFDEATIRRLIAHFQTLLTSIVAEPDRPIADLTYITEEERHQLLTLWNETAVPYPDRTCLQTLFEEQAFQRPNDTAIAGSSVTGSDELHLTYTELNRQANQLAHHLRSLGVGPEAVVGVYMERSVEMVVSLLAILKAGAAYLPMDVAYPAERLAYVLEDAGAPVVISQQSLLTRLAESNAFVFCFDGDWYSLDECKQYNPQRYTDAQNPAYVIYTSGSTGLPKGVVIPHVGVMNLIHWHVNAFDVTHEDHATHLAGTAFDASVWEIWPYLTMGASVYIPADETRASLDDLLDWFVAKGITVTFLPTPLAEAALEMPLPDALSLRFVLTGGDLLRRWPPDDLPFTLVNNYGPTENSVVATWVPLTGDLDQSSIPSIGRPLTNVQSYILDRHMQPTPIGVPGELYIGGASLARGYLNRPELTAEKFVPDPFSEVPGARLYRTGDLVGYLPDGQIEFLGRIDQQVKIRGFRIELGEIEAALDEHASVREVVVIDQEEQPGHKILVAYVVPTEPNALDVNALRSHIAQSLPDYMIPAAFVEMEAIPVTPNGKVDRRALPLPQQTRAALQSSYVAPRNEQEEILADIWSQVLGIEQVGVQDNFFELGGDSIRSIQVIARANQAGVRLTPTQLFQYPTVEGMAQVAGTAAVVQAEQSIVTGSAPLTPIQHWFFQQGFPESHHWNWAFLREVRQPLDPDLLRETIRHLIVHHDALRMRFELTDDSWQQRCADVDEEVPFQLIDLSLVPLEEQSAMIEAEAAQQQTSLDLANGPLLRVVYFKLGDDKSNPRQPDRLLLIFHHLVVDGISMRVLVEDLQSVYSQLSAGADVQLPLKTTSYKEWGEELTTYAQSTALQEEQDFWLRQVQRVTTLPVDFDAGQDGNTEASMQDVSVTLSEEETRALLQEVPEVYHTQINDVLLTALVQSMAKWSGERVLLLDLEGHGREDILGEQIDLSRTVGWFTSIYPVQLSLENVMEPGAALKSIKEQLRAVPNRGIGYGLLRYLRQEDEIGQLLASMPQPEISFNYLGQFDSAVGTSDANNETDSPFGSASESYGPLHSDQCQRPHLLEIVGSVGGGRLRFRWLYSEQIHRRETIVRQAERFMDALRDLIKHCQNPDAGGFTPSDFSMVSGLDQQKLGGGSELGLHF